jgi:hypothetical protein
MAPPNSPELPMTTHFSRKADLGFIRSSIRYTSSYSQRDDISEKHMKKR